MTSPSGSSTTGAPGLRGALARWLPGRLLPVSAAVHVAALALVAAAPRHWRWAVAASVSDHLVMAGLSLLPRAPGLGPNLVRLPAAAAARGEVALTFDDGPDPRVTPAVLDLLAAHGARASFFLIGRRAEAHPALVAEIVQRGHRVENHTYRHWNGFALHGPWAMRREVARAQRRLTALAGRAPTWFRTPAGMRSPVLPGVLAGCGLALATWTRRGLDTVDGSPQRVARRLTARLAAGDVLLLHDGRSAPTPDGRPVVLAALPAVLAAITERGLTALPLPDRACVPGDGSRGRSRPAESDERVR
ncbi:MAG TPA: polysaccharide deacetylase family protein [Thermoanaerobaculia bacterium]|nr:polysaccharide deacetylase family protein [Thermoanaerobaculia bacterium]